MTKSHGKSIGIDLDGVTVNYMPVLIQELNRIYKTNIQYEDVKKFNFEPDFGIPEGAIGKIVCRHARRGVFKTLPAIDDAVNTINELNEEGFRIYIVSSREKEATMDSIDWLDRNGVSFDVAIFSKDKGHYCKRFGIDYLVDDHVKFCRQAQEAGTTPILFGQPWNEESDIMRFETWREIKQYLCNGR